MRTYAYDSYGKVTEIKDYRNLLSDGDKAVKKTYTYDKVGNRLAEDKGDTKTTYDYNGLDQVKTSTTWKDGTVQENKQYVYDKNGNEIEQTNGTTGEILYRTYDAENRLTEVSVNKDGKNAIVQQNRYNGDGQRIQRVEGDQTTNYYYQDGVASYTTDGKGEQTSQDLLETDGNVIGTQRYTGNDAAYYVYNKDVQGSTTNLVRDNGKADVSYRYEDFGETTSVGENTSGNETCYTGGRYDETTGLYYLNARYYNPEDGRFLSEDTYRGETNEPDTQHLYAYCSNNPINYVDPSGHKKKLIGFGLQVSASASVSFLDVGVGIEIVYFFKQIKGGPFAYWYREAGTSTGAAKRGFKKLYKLVKKNPRKLISKPNFSCAICCFAVFSEPYNKSPKAYTKYFKTKSVGAFGYKGFKSTGGGFSVYGAGKSFGNSGLSASKSYYYLIGSIGGAFKSIKNSIKKKAKRFF